MSNKEKKIKTREPGPEFQALASDWKPQVRRAWLVKPPPAETAATTNPADATALALPAEVAVPVSAAPTETAAPSSVVHAEAARAESVAPNLGVTANSAGPPVSVAPTGPARARSAAPKAGRAATAGPETVAAALAGPTNPGGASVSAGGWTKVPNALLETLMCSDLGPRAIRVLLYFTRQTAGFHRDSVELSYVDIANATNVGQAKLPEVLRELTSRGFVQRASGNGKKNRFAVTAVSGVAALAGTAEPARADLEWAATAESVGTTSCRIGGAAEPENTCATALLPPNSGELKKFLLKESFQRNSLSSVPLAWKRYSDTLTEKTRERADSIFEGLVQRFPDDNAEEIAACPENMRSFGAPDGSAWAQIKSPHGLMEIAWPQLRDFYRAKNEARQRTVATKAVDQQRETAEDIELAKNAEIARTAFASVFPDESSQLTALDRFKPSWVSNARAEPGRSVTIDAWFRATGGAAR